MSQNTAPEIRTTTVGSYAAIDWLSALPSEQALVDATRVVVDIQRQAGIDLVTDGELYRFDVNHPDTNGMIDYFVRPMEGVKWPLGHSDWRAFQDKQTMSFRARAAGVVVSALGEGSLNLPADCRRAVAVAGSDIKFTVTSPYMLARTLLDRHYGDFETLLMAVARVLADQVEDLDCACVQLDEANLPGNPADTPMALRACNMVLERIRGEKAVHLCFGNYSGQTIQKSEWRTLIDFLNGLDCDHLILEMARRPEAELEVLRAIRDDIDLGIGVIDIKVNHIETPDEIATRIDKAVSVLGSGRVKWVHPDCGFWMLKRSVADRKIEALVKGRDRFLGR